MDNNTKPSFSANGATTENAGNLNELIEKRKGRPEAGAAWQRTSKAKDMEYMTVRLKFTKERLQELIAAHPDGAEIAINLVAFPNKNQDNPKKPAFRLYEELH